MLNFRMLFRARPITFCLKARYVSIFRKPVEVKFLDETTMRVLNVAEKNDAAKNIAKLLSRGTARLRDGLSKYNKIYEFDYFVFNENCKMIMTSVSGHLLGYEFDGLHRGWNSCNPVDLFSAPVIKQCPKDFENIKRTLEREIRTCNKLIIWTDCDREGENIGFEIIEVCKKVKPNIQVYRAKFSEITNQSVVRALNTLGPPNENINNAVNVRSELDLRIGAAFTRFQTLHLQQAFPEALGQNLISYGSCQFPTLGFVVERYKAIAEFIAEPFWKINVLHKKDDLTVEFNWKRVRLFDQLACQVLFDICKEFEKATVKSVESKPKQKWRPKPLDTVELEKSASRKLKINAKETMRIAEKLYSQGFISYPRTETNIFPKELNLVPLVQSQANDPAWGEFANRVLCEGPNPFNGNKSDQAHPPIHPIKYTNDLNGNEKRVYEFIVRHFLACLSKHAEGLETTVEIDIAEEQFTAKGLMIIAKNYLDVYPYEKWEAKEIHIYQVGEVFKPNIEMAEGQTSPPSPLTEADLIALMEKHGIGTDATHAEHIETIKARLYVGLRENKFFVPRTLGMGLVEGYDSMGFAMSKPNLRAELEADLQRICDGVARPEDVLARQIETYKRVFEDAMRQVEKLDASIQKYYDIQPRPVQQLHNALAPPAKVKKCPRCNSDMILKISENRKFVSCSKWPDCREAFWFPNMVTSVTVTDDSCPECGPDTKLLKFNFERGSVYLPQGHVGCVGGCDEEFLNILGVKLRVNTNRQANNATQVRPVSQNVQSHNFHTSVDSGFSSNCDNSAINDDSDVPNCNCGTPARLFTTRKEGPNQNRQFYGCDKRASEKCEFFKWADEARTSSNSFGNSRSESRNNSNRGNQNLDNGGVENCFCGIPSLKRTVTKDNENKGRHFYVCSKKASDPDMCSFFKWEDDNNGSNARAANTFQMSSSSGSSNTRQNTWPRATSSFNSFNDQNSDTNSEIPNCNCGIPAALLTTKKDGPNLNRQFYACSKNFNERCKFFKWADETSSSKASFSSSVGNSFTRIGNEFRNDTGMGNMTNSENDEIDKCFCALPSVKRTVVKEGPNKGKHFYVCSKPQTDPNKCGFFKWEDENNENRMRLANTFNMSDSGSRNNFNANPRKGVKRPNNDNNPGGRKRQKCSVCGQEGHRKTNCPER